MQTEDKLEKLNARLREAKRIVVAFSGGVDSSVLLKAARDVLGRENVIAITACSELLPVEELEDAKTVAKLADAQHLIVEAHDLDDADVVRNDKNRCYYCKRRRFSMLVDWAKEHGFPYVADGTNVDDTGDYRPGMKAIEELHPYVISPLTEAGWGKADIRRQAKAWGLPVWDKPSAACLASRVAYDIPLSAPKLRAIARVEQFIRQHVPQKGQLRVRHHGNLARIEADETLLEEIFAARKEIQAFARQEGFLYVTLDLAAYRMGSQNAVLAKV